uniref:Uncharacterized protein n=1 Tax=Aegilops tauschii subsp. strangulata TaxID=200361 RepID=A0A453TBT5_AEGTS
MGRQCCFLSSIFQPQHTRSPSLLSSEDYTSTRSTTFAPSCRILLSVSLICKIDQSKIQLQISFTTHKGSLIFFISNITSLRHFHTSPNNAETPTRTIPLSDLVKVRTHLPKQSPK